MIAHKVPLITFAALLGIVTNSLLYAADPTEDSVAKVLSEKCTDAGEKILHSLKSANLPPKIENIADGAFSKPLFPEDFDWNEYYRVNRVIRDVGRNATELWPCLLDHLTDDAYCITTNYDSSYAHNESVGDICFLAVTSWLNGCYRHSAPSDRPVWWRVGPGNQNRELLRDWCRARREKQMYELQIDAAEWVIPFIVDEVKAPSDTKEACIDEIEKKLAALRESRKPIPGYVFITGISLFSSKKAHRMTDDSRDQDSR